MVGKWAGVALGCKSPIISGVVSLPNGLNDLNGLYMGVTNHWRTGMILQVPPHPRYPKATTLSPVATRADRFRSEPNLSQHDLTF